MSTHLSVPIQRGQSGDIAVSDEFLIHASRFDVLKPEFFLRNADDTFFATVDAEAFYRAVCAAWELVKPLGTRDAV